MKIKYIFITLLNFIIYNHTYAQSVFTPERVAEINSVWNSLDLSRSLFVNGNNVKDDVGTNVAYSFIITPYSPFMKVGTYFFWDRNKNKKNGRTGAYMFGLSVKDIFSVLYGKPMWIDPRSNKQFPASKIPNSNIVFKEIDTSKLGSRVNGRFSTENLWTIQVTSSNDVSQTKFRKQMILAAELQFGLKTYLERQTKRCIVISRNNIPIPEYSGGEFDFRIGSDKSKGHGLFFINNIPLEQLIFRFQRIFDNIGYPIIDETGLAKNLGKIEFTTNEPKLNLDNLTEHLAKFGLKLTIEEREVDVLVITKGE